MFGAGPSWLTHSFGGFSAASTTRAPRANKVMVFCFADNNAEATPADAARSNSVGRNTRSELSMYNSWPVASSKKKLAVIPCASGQAPQHTLALLAFVTEGITPGTVLRIPCRPHLASTGISLAVM